jgi:hypothetical protein
MVRFAALISPKPSCPNFFDNQSSVLSGYFLAIIKFIGSSQNDFEPVSEIYFPI